MKKIHKYDNNIIEYAREIAMKSDMKNKHGCVIIDYRKTVISAECNKTINISQKKLHNKIFDKNKKISRHAEENALRNADNSKLCGATLYIVRTGIDDNNNNIFMNSKPCEKCTSIINSCIRKFGLKVVYYTTGQSDEI